VKRCRWLKRRSNYEGAISTSASLPSRASLYGSVSHVGYSAPATLRYAETFGKPQLYNIATNEFKKGAGTVALHGAARRQLPESCPPKSPSRSAKLP